MRSLRFSRIKLLQALTVVVLLAPMLGGGFYVWTKHQLLQTQLSDLEPRFARLQGLLQHQTDLQSLAIKVNAQLAGLAYPASQDATKAGNDAQQRIRSVFADSKLEVISIQVLPPKQVGGVDRVQISLRVEGDITGMYNALTNLAAQSPLVVVDSLALQTIGVVRPASVQRLGGQLNLSVFRMRS